jgi:hypothetical protein
MPVKLFSLRNVPDDEAEEIRELLSNNGIAYYETPAGNWGISMPAIWLRNKDQLQKAKYLIQEYQSNRAIRAREQYEQLGRKGNLETIFDKIKEDPIRFLIYLAIVFIVLYISTKPFIDMWAKSYRG